MNYVELVLHRPALHIARDPPGVKVVYEFPNATMEAAAREFLQNSPYAGIVTTRVRSP